MSTPKFFDEGGAFEAFVDRVEAAIRRVPVSELVAERARIQAAAVARLARPAAQTSYVAHRRSDWSESGLYIGGLVAVLVFIAVWALTALMGGLWGFLLGWLPASIIAKFCFYAWRLLLAVVVIAVFGIAAVVTLSTAPQPPAEQASSVKFDDLIPAHPPEGNQAAAAVPAPVAQASAQSSPVAAAAQDARPPEQVAQIAPPASTGEAPAVARDASWADHDERVAAAVRGAPLVNATSSELNALFEECPSHRIAGDPAAGIVCAPSANPAPTVAAPSASAPVPAASAPQ